MSRNVALSPSDATDPCSIKESAQRVGSLLGKEGLNMLVNNAGVLPHGNIQSTSSEDMQSAFKTNVMGPMNITKVRRSESFQGTHCCTCKHMNI